MRPYVGEEMRPYVGEDVGTLSLKYCRVQESLYEMNFSLQALVMSTDLESFVSYLPKYTESDITMSSLAHFKKKAALSRESGDALLRLISSLKPAVPVPSRWKTISNHITKKCTVFEGTTLRREVPWPESFQMHLFNEPGIDRLPPVVLIARDPLELIASKLACPSTMFINGAHVQFEYAAETLQDGTPCVSNLMSSDYAKHSQDAIRAIDQNGYFLPIITYADGVALGLRNKVRTVVLLMPIPVHTMTVNWTMMDMSTASYVG